MDNLQIQHAIDQIEMHAAELKEFLLSNHMTQAEREELKDRISELEDDLEKSEDKQRDTELENDDLKDNIKKAKDILDDIISADAGHDYAVGRIQEILEFL